MKNIFPTTKLIVKQKKLFLSFIYVHFPHSKAISVVNMKKRARKKNSTCAKNVLSGLSK